MQVGILLFLQNLINFPFKKCRGFYLIWELSAVWRGKCSELRCLCFFLSFVFCSLRVYRRCIEINLTLQHLCSVSRSERLALSDKRKCRNRAAASGLRAMLPRLSLSLSRTLSLFLLEAPAQLFLTALCSIFSVEVVSLLLRFYECIAGLSLLHLRAS